MDKLKDLNMQRQKLEERIKELESELKRPLTQDLHEDAAEEENREVVYGHYQVEKENLERINTKIKDAL